MKNYLTSKEDKHLLSITDEDKYRNNDRRDFKRKELEFELRHEEPELYRSRLKNKKYETR
jgi:hypothetical protein